MNLEEYNELKKLNVNEIHEKLKKAIPWIDEAGNPWFTGDYVVIFCFILWNIKRKDNYDTVDNYIKYCSGDERISLFDDVLEFLENSNLWDEFISLKDDFTDEELIAVVLNELRSGYQQRWEPMPDGLLSLVDKVLDIHDNGAVTEYCANGFEYAIYKALRDNKIQITSYEDTYERAFPECVKQMLGLDNITILGEVDNAIPSDKLFVNFGNYQTVSYMVSEELSKNEKIPDSMPKEASETRDKCVAAICSLKDNGKALIMMRASQLSGKEDEVIRRFLIENNYVSGVIALSEKLYSSTWVNTYILILEKNSKSVRFCDAREKYEKNRSFYGKQVNLLTEEIVSEIYKDYLSGNEFSTGTALEVIKDNDYVLLPQRYIKTNSYKETFQLGDRIRELSRGITLSGKDTDKFVGKGTTKCITPMSISNGVIAKPTFFDKDSFDKKINYTRWGDLLINKTGKPLRTAVADDTYAVVGNIYIIKLDYGTDPYYVKCFLDSPKGQEELSKYMVGETSPSLTLTNLNKVEIPVFEEAKQKSLEEKAAAFTRELQSSINKLDELSEMFE